MGALFATANGWDGAMAAVAQAVVQRLAEAHRLCEAALGTITIQSLVASLEAEAMLSAEAPPCAASG